MNNTRRKKIYEITRDLQSALYRLESVKDEEEYYFDNMPENLQGSMRGEESQDAISALEDAYDSLSEAIDSIELAC